MKGNIVTSFTPMLKEKELALHSSTTSVPLPYSPTHWHKSNGTYSKKHEALLY